MQDQGVHQLRAAKPAGHRGLGYIRAQNRTHNQAFDGCTQSLVDGAEGKKDRTLAFLFQDLGHGLDGFQRLG